MTGWIWDRPEQRNVLGQVLVLGFGGMTVAGGSPASPRRCHRRGGSLRFRVRWRGRLLEVTPTGSTAIITAQPSV
jgi:trehalose/maltose hydrolase-like predicted phosphorylase